MFILDKLYKNTVEKFFSLDGKYKYIFIIIPLIVLLIVLSFLWENFFSSQENQLRTRQDILFGTLSTMIKAFAALLALVGVFMVFKLDHVKRLFEEYIIRARGLLRASRIYDEQQFSDKKISKDIKETNFYIANSIKIIEAEEKRITENGKNLVMGLAFLIICSIILLIFTPFLIQYDFFGFPIPVDFIVLFLIASTSIYLIKSIVDFFKECFSKEE